MAFQTDVVIIGAGPVGLFTIFQCGMLGLKVHVFDGLPHVGGQCSALYPDKPIYDIPAYPKILGKDLIDNLFEQAKPFDPVYHFKNKVVGLENIKNSAYLWKITSDQGIVIETKALIIAAGVGAFGPNKPPLENLETFEKKSIHYFIPDKNIYKDKHVAIAGGGDSAVDWAIALETIAKRVTLIHRRDRFRATPQSEKILKELVAADKIDMKTPYQLYSVQGKDDMLESLTIQHFTNQSLTEIKVDYLLPFFGLSMNLGPIAEWGLGLHKKHIDIDQTTSSTNKKGVYAIGDVATYPHKLKLILTGFSEAAYAAHAIYRQINPDKPLHFEHSTTKGLFVKK